MLERLVVAFVIMGKGMAGIFCVVLLIMLFIMLVHRSANNWTK